MIVSAVLPEIVRRIDVTNVVTSDGAGSGHCVAVHDFGRSVRNDGWRKSQSKALQCVWPELGAAKVVEGSADVGGNHDLFNDARKQQEEFLLAYRAVLAPVAKTFEG